MDLWIGAPAWLEKPLYGLRAEETRRVIWVYSTSFMNMSMDSASWKYNSASLLKIALVSESLFLDSVSLVVEPQPFLVKTQISELSGDSLSWTGWDSDIVELDDYFSSYFYIFIRLDFTSRGIQSLIPRQPSCYLTPESERPRKERKSSKS